MKKLLFLAATTLVALTMNAQHVTPLDVTMVEMHLDSLRAAYVNDRAGYYTQLQHVELDLNGNEDALKQARKQLNEEKSYAKCIADYLKDASKVLKTVEKDCNDEIKDLTSLQNTIDKQTATANKLTLVTHDSRPKFVEHMAEERNQIATEQNSIKKRSSMIAKQQAQIITIQNGLDIYNNEIATKENDLKLKEGQLKANQDALKNEMKIVKAELKGKK